MSHPYSEFENSRLWRAIQAGIEKLQENSDLELTTAPEYVVGFLCKEISRIPEFSRELRREIELRLFALRALWGEVTPNLRAFSATYESDETVRLDFYYDGEVGDDEAESAACVATEIIADLPDDLRFAENVVRLDAPAPLPPDRSWIYVRKE